MAGIQINGTLDVRWPSLLDKRSGKLVGSVTLPYDSTAEVFSLLPGTRRAEGLVVFVKNGATIEWWQFQGGILDEHLVKVFPRGPMTGTITAPADTIVVPAGLFRELVLEVAGEDPVDTTVSIGLTELDPEIEGSGIEIDDSIIVPADKPYEANVSKRFKEETTIYITTQNDLTYEFYYH